jgi:hypothetical protein
MSPLHRAHLIRLAARLALVAPCLALHLAPHPQALAAPDLPPALARINTQMRATLQEAIDEERRALGAVILYEGGALKLLRDGQEVAAFPAAPPPLYHQLKAVSHLAFTLTIELRREGREEGARRGWITHMTANTLAAREELGALNLPAPLSAHALALIDESLTLLTLAEASPHAAPPREALSAYITKARPHLDAAIYASAQAHLDALEPAGRALYALLTPQERESARAYLYGGRGARVDNLVLQYLSWLLGEGTGRESGRVVFSEGIFERAPALDALARYGAERALAEEVFGDPERLHRDVLGDATRALLKGLPPARERLSEPLREP